MNRRTTIAALLVALPAAYSLTTFVPEPRAQGAAGAAVSAQAALDSANFDNQRAIARLEASIKGRENAPAESVWKNIKSFTGVPAGRVLKVMEMGFSPALGVNCLHCHKADDFATDDKRAKRVARDMMELTRVVNTRLREVKELASEEPAINCTTCHRGEIKPALNLPKKADER